MNKSEKALLLSCLVYPGAGHLLLKKHVTGWVLIVTTTAALYALVSLIVTKVIQIQNIIRTDDIDPSIATIFTLFAQHQTIRETQTAAIALVIITVAWLIGIADVNRRVRTQQSEP